MGQILMKLIKYLVLFLIGIFITPYLVMLFGLGIMLIGAFSTSPVINALRLRMHRAFSSAEVDVEKIEDTDKLYTISWKDSLTLFFIGLLLFIASIIILSLGWRGIIFML